MSEDKKKKKKKKKTVFFPLEQIKTDGFCFYFKIYAVFCFLILKPLSLFSHFPKLVTIQTKTCLKNKK
jgi:hypothetical protein